MSLRRVLGMSRAELDCRLRQQAARVVDRLGGHGPRTWGVDTLATKLAVGPLADDVRRRLRDGARDDAAALLLRDFVAKSAVHFFPGASDVEIGELLDARVPGARDTLLAEADLIRNGRFDLLGYRALDFGDPVDWRLDPVAGKRAPVRHWTRLDPLDASAVGDHKVIWELNRHQWMVRLGQAYRLTGDGRYAKAFAGQLQSWIDANPRGIGINWVSSLELAYRAIAWVWALALFAGSDELSPGLFARTLDAIESHAAHVERHLSFYFAPNTHLTGEALGLFYVGAVFPQLASARRWRERGAEILIAESARHILPDGVYFEQSTAYQRYTIDLYSHFLILAARAGVSIPPAVAERVERAVDFLLAIRWPDGSLPAIGDADGGRLLPLASRRPDDFGDVFSTAATLFSRPDHAWAAGGLAPETLWLIGSDAAVAFDGLDAAPPPNASSSVFRDGGYVVMRSSREPDAQQLLLDVGPLASPRSGSHAHADLLAIQCAVFGTPYLVDGGTYSYTTDAAWRECFRSTRAHSTVLVDDLPQAETAGPFAWRSFPQARLVRHVTTPELTWVAAEHDGYRRLGDPVRHRRRVALVRSSYWIVVDDLDGCREHRVELAFQFAPLGVRLEPDGWVRAADPRGHAVWLKPFATAPLRATVHEGEAAARLGFISPDYGVLLPAPLVRYVATGPLPLRIVTVLRPVEVEDAPAPAVRLLVGEDGRPAGVVVGEDEIVEFRDDRVELRRDTREESAVRVPCVESSAS